MNDKPSIAAWLVPLVCLGLFIGACAFSVSLRQHPQDAKYQVGQVVTLNIPGDELQVVISDISFWGDMKRAEYHVQFMRDGEIVTLEYIKEWKLK